MNREPAQNEKFFNAECPLCGAAAAREVPGFPAFHRVTSDCKPWPAGGRLFVCRECGHAQKESDPNWRADAEAIYDSYAIYQQSGGAEQIVRNNATGQTEPRSARFVEKLRANVPLPETGRLLDIGCGNGALLREFSRVAPQWKLSGSELSEKHRAEIESINGVEAFYDCSPESIPGKFDIITMIHVIEHIPSPVGFLNMLRDKLNPGGLLAIQAPDYTWNPFELLVADHVGHFTIDSASLAVRKAGYEVVVAATDWVPKELSLIARNSETPMESAQKDASGGSFAVVENRLQWLQSVLEDARKIAAKGRFGIFGSAIAAAWLFGEMPEAVSFFVDEDESRSGNQFLGRPIHLPCDVPEGSRVFVALPPIIADGIRDRMQTSGLPFSCYAPPPIAELET